MSNSPESVNRHFLLSLDTARRHELLAEIAKHYGASSEVIFEELTSAGSEFIYEYIPEGDRRNAIWKAIKGIMRQA